MMKSARILLMVFVLAVVLAGFMATPTTTDASNHQCAWFASSLVVDYASLPDGGWFKIGAHHSDDVTISYSKGGTTVNFLDTTFYLGPTVVNGRLEGSLSLTSKKGSYQLVDPVHNISYSAKNEKVTIADCP